MAEATRSGSMAIMGLGLLLAGGGIIHLAKAVSTADSPAARLEKAREEVARCNRAGQQYHDVCDSPASCKGPEYRESGTCRETAVRLGTNLACVALRAEWRDRCGGGVDDAGHAAQIDARLNAAARCAKVAAAHCGEAFGQKAAEKVQRAGSRQVPK